jgi:hypothetical protein
MWPTINDKDGGSTEEKVAEPSEQAKASKAELAFDDDFAPFVSSSDASSSSHKDPQRPEDWEKELALVDDGDDGSTDPTARLANMFASLADLKDQAMSLPEGDRRKDFAAEIAMKFAKQLDSLIKDDDDEAGAERR